MKKIAPILILSGCAIIFALGAIKLFELRFERGDVYPPYSSLRADPLGTMAFYESLQKVADISVRRDFSDANRLPEQHGTVYLHLAGNSEEWESLSTDSFHDLENFLARGNRLVITFFPQTEEEDFFFHNGEETNPPAPVKSKEGKHLPPPHKATPDAGEDKDWVALQDEWGFHPGFKALMPDGDSYAPVPVDNRTALPLPSELDWHSGEVFTNWNSQWHVIYARGTNAVVMERHFGSGSVVLATDTYFASNEAMSRDRHADLLAWLVGSNKNVVFDEAHFGILETGGVATLMRKYRLHGVAAGLILLAGLFIWKNSTSLVPPHTYEKPTNIISGKDSAEGFINLLRRSISPRNLLATCFSEWEKSIGSADALSRARGEAAQKIFLSEDTASAPNQSSVETYRKIARSLQIRKTSPTS
ncbi:MAG TPA: DUF4350 domain-containing protein [Verrucomicrobiae bacterium]|jgi:hypothetical protein